MKGKRCFFIGHRDTTNEILPVLHAAIKQHITEYGVTEFLVGKYGGFDRLAAQCLIEAKQTHPEISLILLLPYHPTERKVELLKDFDGSCYPPGQESVLKQVAIVRANRYAVDYSNCLIAYAWHALGATLATSLNMRRIKPRADKSVLLKYRATKNSIRSAESQCLAIRSCKK